jgi:hypothetical protein
MNLKVRAGGKEDKVTQELPLLSSHVECMCMCVFEKREKKVHTLTNHRMMDTAFTLSN